MLQSQFSELHMYILAQSFSPYLARDGRQTCQPAQ
jgi:hypothetical protein